MDTQWLANRPPRSDAQLRLFCLTYAGASAAVYHGWRRLLPDHVDLCAVELPGRGGRWAESAFIRLEPLVRTMATELEPAFDVPFAFFGHSMGGLLAFELARTLRERGQPVPSELFVSAAAAPTLARDRPQIHQASDAELKAEVQRLGGTPPEILGDDELMAVTLPILRADYAVLETYTYRHAEPLETPITVFGGEQDPIVPPTSLHDWAKESVADTRVRMFGGDHFFLRSATVEVVNSIVRELDRHRPDDLSGKSPASSAVDG